MSCQINVKQDEATANGIVNSNNYNWQQLKTGKCLCSHRSSLKQQETQRAAYRAPEYNVPPFLRNRPGRHFCLLIGQNNTNMVQDVKILLPVMFH